MQRSDFKTTDEYIATFPPKVQDLLQVVRQTIKKAAPGAGEKISYQIPTFTLHGNLVHFAGYQHHIGFYPGAEPIRVFEKELSGFKTAKGSIQFPLDQPLPLELITKIVEFRVKENSERKSKY